MSIPKLKYSNKQVERLLIKIHNGTITEKDLPEDLYYRIGEYLTKGLYKGFGSTLANIANENEALLTDLRENIYLFSAAKTYQFTRAASDLLINEQGEIKPFKQFYEEGKVIAGDYLESWAQAEYNTTIGQAQMAEQWQSIEANKNILPMLTFSTDGAPCPECEPFEGLTAPVDDEIWYICTPLLHFNCMCILIPSDDAEATPQDKIDDLPINENIPKEFQNNPGKTGEIFPPSHGYFDGVPKELAKNNFGLDIPDED